MASDDLSARKPAVERLGLDHQIRITHVKKRVWNRLDRIDGWDWIKARIWRRLTKPPFDGYLELLRLERAGRRRGSSPYARGSEREAAGAVMPSQAASVPWTNNAAERAIDGIKIRRKPVMGYKSEDGMLNGFGLRRRAWSGLDGLA